jgi:hypothetical protein
MDNEIGGDLQLESNDGEQKASGNEIGGDLEAIHNAGGLLVAGNRIHGNFRCKEKGAELESPAGARCVLERTRIRGSLTLGPGVSVVATGVDVDGDVRADGARVVELVAARVGGGVRFAQGGTARVAESAIAGELQLFSNDGELVASGNAVGGDLQAFENVGGPSLAIAGNTIGGSLQCAGNDPAPVGGDNTVDGDREGQCAEL